MTNDSPELVQPIGVAKRPLGLIATLFICSIFPLYCGLLILSVVVEAPVISLFFIINLLPALIFLFYAIRIWVRPIANLPFGCSIINLMLLQILLLFFNVMVVPTVVTAVPRGKQKRTMENMKTIGRALEQYQEQNHHYPIAQEIPRLKKELVPKYLETLPELDGWNRPIHYEFSHAGSDYFLYSTGKDGVMDVVRAKEYTACDIGNFESDIVMNNGIFIRAPLGKQRYRRNGASDDICEPSTK